MQIKKINLNQKSLSVISIVISFLLIIIFSLSYFDSTKIKIGVVEMEELVYEYKGMKDATKSFSGKVAMWNKETDSLKKKLEFYLYEIKMDSINGDKAKMQKDQQKFLLLRSSFMQLQEKLSNQSKTEDQEMTVGVINQIRQHIKDYSIENGYDLIITNNQMQSVGFSKENLDITKDLLNYCNAKYEDEN